MSANQYTVKDKKGLDLENNGEWRHFPQGATVALSPAQGRQLFKEGKVIPLWNQKAEDPLFVERR